MKTYCCHCEREIEPTRVSGYEIYPHRHELHMLVIWKCDACGNYVSSSKVSGGPQGCIPTPAIRKLRKKIHSIIDPIWTYGHATRTAVYRKMGEMLGREFHAGSIRTEAEANEALDAAERVFSEFVPEPRNG